MCVHKFYLECPGGAHNVCSNHGFCLDTEVGNGSCLCQVRAEKVVTVILICTN